MAEPPTELPSTADRIPGSQQPIAAGKPEENIEVLVGRWLMLGCAATALVLLVAAVVLGWVMVSGLMAR